MLLEFIVSLCLVIGISADGKPKDSTVTEQFDKSCDAGGKSSVIDKVASEPLNYTAIEEYIDKKVQKANAETYMELEHELLKLKEQVLRISACPGVIYGYTCFFVVIDQSPLLRVDYFDAKSLCQSFGDKVVLGNIYSETHYNKMVSHIRSRRLDSPLSFINFWTAMKRDIPEGTVRMDDGSIAPYVGDVRNLQEWNTVDKNRLFVYVSVWTDGDSHDSNPGGFGNVWPSNNWNAALCQYSISTETKIV